MNNYLCASPPQFKDLNQSNSAFKRLVADSPMSTNKKLNLNTGSQKKKKYICCKIFNWNTILQLFCFTVILCLISFNNFASLAWGKWLVHKFIFTISKINFIDTISLIYLCIFNEQTFGPLNFTHFCY